ncbi:MAG: hypothetical protein KF901_23155 [Myxococcales bacterium]|nr:hypothetical protein [Myxococcales bacterium]
MVRTAALVPLTSTSTTPTAAIDHRRGRRPRAWPQTLGEDVGERAPRGLPHVAASSLGLLALCVACGGSSPSEDPLSCPPSAPIVGVAGEVTTEAFPLTFGADGASAELVVPEDLTALALVAEDGLEYTAFWTVQQDGRRWIDLDADPDGLDAPFFHTWNHAASLTFPSNEASALARGCLRVEVLTDGPGPSGTLHVLTRRRAEGGTMRVDLVRVGATELPGSSFDTLATELAAVFEATGLAVSIEVSIAAVPGDPFPPAEGEATLRLRGSYRPADAVRIPIYVIQGFVDELDTLGIAGGIPGANGVPGAASAGVLVAVDPHLDEEGRVDVLTMAETAAHELGHQLGLFHTTEAEGLDHDPLGDTAECPASRDTDGDGVVSAEECADLDGGNLMFWISGSFPQRELSPWQRRLLALSPVVR